MNKIFEFVENSKKSEILKYLDVFVFFDGNNWMFADQDKEFLNNYIEGILPINDFIELGNKLAENLNKMNVPVTEYDFENINDYLNYK